MRVIQPRFTHTVGVSLALPNAHAFVPLPNMAPTEIAFEKGREAGRLGHRADRCPYDKGTHPGLNEHWMKGFNNAAPKSDPTRRLHSGSEPGDDLLGETGDEGDVS